MPYATDGSVSCADMSGDPAWVEISEEQYQLAIDGMSSGRLVSVDNGFAVVEPPEPEKPDPELFPPQYPLFFGNQKLDLFTPAEQLAVVTATMQDPVVKLLYDRLLGSAYMTYEDPETEHGLALLVDKGLLTPERKAEIVAAMQPQ